MTLFDKHGVPIRPFDLLKMYHFTGARRKKYFMYKWVIEKNGRLYGHHLDRRGGDFLLSQDLLRDSEIVQGFDGNGKSFEARRRDV